jgi:endonuclease YncB( thermonuclease family)
VRRLLSALLLALLVLAAPAVASAAEVLQVRGATLLQVGDGNRSSPVRLACLEVPAARQEGARAWLRQELPRRTRVNLLPAGQSDGVLLARVVKLDGQLDLGQGLIEAGLAQPSAACPA